MNHKISDKDILKAGYLTKLGKQIKSWKRRYFILTESYLMYFENDKPNAKLKGCVDLSEKESCSITRGDMECHKSPSFKLVTKNRILFAYTTEVEHLESWIKILSDLFAKQSDAIKLDENITDEQLEKLALDVE